MNRAAARQPWRVHLPDAARPGARRGRGDALLIALARRWEQLAAHEGVLCHMNADQFGFLLRDIDDTNAVIETAARILDSMYRPITLNGIERPRRPDLVPWRPPEQRCRDQASRPGHVPDQGRRPQLPADVIHTN
jgi:hypothetical protein